MPDEKHPLLAQAWIDDDALNSELWEFGTVNAPDLTFQYDDRGEIDNSFNFTRTPLCEDAPAVYRERFIRRWTVEREKDGLPNLDGATCWERLRELVADRLQDLPDNEFVLEKAWLAGLVAAMPPRFRAALDQLHARIAEYRERVARELAVTNRARMTGERQALDSWVTDRCYNHNSSQCSFDRATLYVLPDGSRKTVYVCCC